MLGQARAPPGRATTGLPLIPPNQIIFPAVIVAGLLGTAIPGLNAGTAIAYPGLIVAAALAFAAAARSISALFAART